jgi:hypothetical protein
LRAGLLVLADQPLQTRRWYQGVRDTFGVLLESVAKEAVSDRVSLPAALARFVQLLKRHRATPPKRAKISRFWSCGWAAAPIFCL